MGSEWGWRREGEHTPVARRGVRQGLLNKVTPDSGQEYGCDFKRPL